MFIDAIEQVSKNRVASVQFDQTGLLKTLNDTLDYTIENWIPLTSMAFKPINPHSPFGHGGFASGVDAILASRGKVQPSSGGSSRKVLLKTTPKLPINATVSGNRSKLNIMRVIRQNTAALKYAYNRRLKAKPSLKGKLKVKWAVDEFGNVLHCKIISSTMKDPTFESIVLKKIKRWKFGKIQIPGDVTEIMYTFVFKG